MSETTKKLLEENSNLAKRIKNDFDNFKATTVDRINLEFCIKRLEVLEYNWAVFETNHQKIMVDNRLDGSDPYFANDVRDETDKSYRAYGDKLREKISAFRNPLTLGGRETRSALSNPSADRNVFLHPEIGAEGGSTTSPRAQENATGGGNLLRDIFQYHSQENLNRSRLDEQLGGAHGSSGNNRDDQGFNDYGSGNYQSKFNQRNTGFGRSIWNDWGGAKKKTQQNVRRTSPVPLEDDDEPARNDSIVNPGLQMVMQQHERLLHKTASLYDNYTQMSVDTNTVKEMRIARLKILRQWVSVEGTYQTLINGGCDYDAERYHLLEDRIEDLQCEEEESEARQAPRGNNQQNRDDTIRIPKVEVPQFNGDILKYITFKALFQQMVGSKTNLTDTQKMVYLIQNTKGEANSLIASFQITDASYAQAWARLDERYNSKYRIATFLTEKILNLEPMKPNNANSLVNLLNTVAQCSSGLTNAGLNTNIPELSFFLHNVVIDKIDKHTLSFYENGIVNKSANRKLEDLISFLQATLHNVENVTRKKQTTFEKENAPARAGFSKKPNAKPFIGNYNPNSGTTLVASPAGKSSSLCDCREKHQLFKCPAFIKLTPKKRYAKCKDLKRCVNCLREGHIAKDCNGKKCPKCNKGHNSLLHFEPKKQDKTTLIASAIENENFKHVFLATAIINITNKIGKPVKARALLDSGSQLNIITNKMFNKLGIESSETSMFIKGVGCHKAQAQKRSLINIESQHSAYKTPLEVFVVNKLTTCQPSQFVDTSGWNIPSNIALADPKFNIPDDVDIVIGGELFFKMMSTGMKAIGKNLPDLQNTVFGWVVIGKLLGLEPNEAFMGIATLEEQLSEFWKIEEKNHNEKSFNEFEQACENYYDETTVRDPDSGKFIVNLQFVKEPAVLGKSVNTAVTRFYHLENKFKRDPEMKKDYVKFMREYEDLNHMKQVSREELGDDYYVIPHHAVRNPTSSSTQFRVVFDASARTSSNVSLNNILANGPMLQDDLFSIMVRFRKHKYVFSADITKMYRQVLVTPEHQKWQVIVWRENPEDQLKFYKLLTVTYGTTCASYLAIKSLQKLADEHKDEYPLASVIAKRDFNVDDVMTGSDDLQQLVKTQKQLIELLERAGFHLHKWCSNNYMLLKDIPSEKREVSLEFNSEKTETKALGMKWVPSKDEFMLHYSPTHHQKVTKRTVLSETAQLFDPLGLVNPVIVLAKIFQQELWTLKLDWDDKLPQNLVDKWLSFRERLPVLNILALKRYISIDSPVNIQIHTFSDASIKAYGAVVFLRTENANGEINVSIICSKSRVAPISATTLPRLELCAATIAAELTKKIIKVLDFNINKVFYWTDSELVLSWIYSETSYKTFVANRVAAIKRITSTKDWKYVPTKENPADIISRGCLPDQLLTNTLWWNGPEFLQQEEHMWPQNKPAFVRDPSEEKIIKTVLLAAEDNREKHFISQINHRNSIKTWQHVTAYCLRTFNRTPKINASSNEDWESAVALTPSELNRAMIELVKYCQNEKFAAEKELLLENELKKSRFASLSPFIDQHGVIRVGGRLQAANIPYEQQHPALLPKDHLVTVLIMEQIHRDNKHVGPQALLAITRQKYWPENGKRLAQAVVRNCVLCARYKPKLLEQVMGDLPKNRVNINRSFSKIGIDYGGPVLIHHKIRGKAPTKAYICIFVCFVTKAVHIEAAVDLSTEAFISYLKRFIARRGIPSTIYSDNGSNFVGANNQLQELQTLLKNPQHRQQVYEYCQDHCIEWQFMPPRSPHMGGLHESGIKSAKTHLKKIMHAAHLTYDELSTVLAEIEAILNSRPLTSLSNNPNDLQPLTAGHFLIGAPMNAINDGDVIETSKTKTWYKLAQLKHEFWNRWSKEYLAELQQKKKWTKVHDSIKEGALVMLRDSNLPPLQWKMARISKTYPDSQGKVRVVKLHTTSGEGDNIKVIEIKRSIHEISPLPETFEEDNIKKPEPVHTKVQQNTIKKAVSARKQAVPAKKKPVPAKKKAVPVKNVKNTNFLENSRKSGPRGLFETE